MEKSPPKHSSHDRIGFRYYPDTLHYKESDLQAWLPELRALDAGWLVLETPVDRAIPEEFIHRLVAAGIQPVLQMHMPLTKLPDHDTFAVLVRAYASWGVQYIVPFDKPNVQQSWGSDGWVQQRLVDRFLDLCAR